MKTQNQIIVVCIILIIGFHASCSRILNSERNKAKLIQKEDVRMSTEQTELINGNRLIQLIDSSSKFFSIEIYPMDTFTLSVNDGFKGRASKIELRGVQRDIINVSDSTNLWAESVKSLQFEGQNEIKEKRNKASKEVKSQGLFWFVILFLAGFILVLYGLFQIHRRFRKYVKKA